MPIDLITNPNGAFNESSHIGNIYIVAENTNGNSVGTIAVNKAVIWDAPAGGLAPPTHQITGAAAASSGQLFVGLAMDSIAANATGRVATQGVFQALVGTTNTGITLATVLILDSTTAGDLTNSTGTTVVGLGCATGLQTSTTLGGLAWVVIQKQ